MQNKHPELNNRAQGWLNFLYRKATTPDDWSEAVSYTHLTLPTKA